MTKGNTTTMQINQNMTWDMKDIPAEFQLDEIDEELLDIDPIRWDNSIMHQYDVKGTYAATGGPDGKLIEKPYHIKGIQATDEEVKKYGAVHTFLATVAKDTFPQIYGDFSSILTHLACNSKSFKNGRELDLPTDISLMDRNQAVQHIKDQGFPIDITLFNDLGELRQAIRDCIKDQRAFKKNQIIKMKKRADGPKLDTVRHRNQGVIDALLNGANAESTKAPELPTITEKQLQGNSFADLGI